MSGYRRLRLRRADGRIYLDRWGLSLDRIAGVYLHRMAAPDPGVDLHDHPWTFVTIPLWGGYTEERALSREAQQYAMLAEAYPTCTRGVVEERLPRRPRMMRLDECHRITHLSRRTVWTLVLRGPRRRSWGFFEPGGWVRAQNEANARRPLAAEPTSSTRYPAERR